MIACPETILFNREGWTWRLRDSSVLDFWFNDFLEGRIGEPLRSTSNKDIFRIVSYERPFIVRSYHPKRAFSKLKSRVVPKAKDEYESFLLLEDAEVPSAECIGWGRRGPDSISIVREIPNSMSVRDFWFSNVSGDEISLRQPFLVEFARMLSRLLLAGLYHPDLRLSRLSVSGDPFMFHVNEPYGLTRPPVLDASMKLRMIHCIGELRGEINTGEAAAIIMYAGVEQDATKVVELWNVILHDETAAVDALWPKRKSQIIACDPRFCVTTDGLLLRCGYDGLPMLLPDELSPKGLEKFDRLDFKNSHDEALRLWLLSCKLMLHRLRHRSAVMMETDPEGKPVALHMERRDGIVAGGQPCIKEFIDKCVMAGIDPRDLESNLDVIDGKVEIADIRKIRLEV